MRIGIPVKAGERAWPGNGGSRAGGCLRQTRGRGSVERVQTATQLACIWPRSFVVLGTLSNRSPVVVEPAIGGSQNGIARQLVSEPDSRLDVGEVVLKDGAVGMGSNNDVGRQIALPWLWIQAPGADAEGYAGWRRISLGAHRRQVREDICSVVKV